MNEYKEKTIKSIIWNLIERFGVQGFRFVVGIILARLLTPKDYGLIGMITVFFAVAQVFIEGGFGQAYVQKSNIDEKDTNTIFYTNLVVSLIAYFLLFIFAPHIALFYNQPELINLTRVMGIIVIISAFNVVQVAQITRDLNFKRKTRITLTGSVIGGAIGITAAYSGLGVWALIIQQLSNRLIITIGMWISSKWKPKLTFSMHSLKSMFNFGFWILIVNIINKVFENIYALIIGKFFSASELGYYSKAKSFLDISTMQFSGAISVVAFPVFANLQNDSDRLKQNMEHFFKYTYFIVIPLLVVFFVLAEPFVIVVLTKKWMPIIPYMKLMCILGIFYPLNSLNHQLLLAMGKSKLNFIINIVCQFLTIINIFIAIQFGVLGIIFGSIIIAFIRFLIISSTNIKYIKLNAIDQILLIKNTLIIGSVVSILSKIFISLINQYVYQLLFGSILIVLMYLLLQYLFNKQLFVQLFNNKKILGFK